MPHPPSVAHLLGTLPASAAARGAPYLRGDAIAFQSLEEERATFKVRGSRRTRYTVHIDIEEGVAEYADCDCPVGDGGSCKHVYACLVRLGDLLSQAPAPRSTADAPEEEVSPMSARALVDTLKARGLGWVLDIPVVHLIEPIASAATLYSARYRHHSLTVVQALAGQDGWGVKVIPDVQAAARQGLLAQLEIQARTEAEGEAREIHRARPPEDPVLQDLYAALRREQALLRKLHPRVLRPTTGDAALRLDAPEEALRFSSRDHVCLEDPRAAREARIEIPLEPPPRGASLHRCPHSGGNGCPLHLSAVEAALDLLTDPKASARRRPLIAHLKVPAWERRLLQLDTLLEEEAGEADPEERQLGFEVSFTPAGVPTALTPVLTRPYKRKAGLRTWSASARSLAPLTGALSEVELDCLDQLLAEPWERRSVDVPRLLHSLVGHPRVLDRGGQLLRITAPPLRIHLAEGSIGQIRVQIFLGAIRQDPAHVARLLGEWPSGARYFTTLEPGSDTLPVIQLSPKRRVLILGLLERVDGLPKEAIPSLVSRLPRLMAQLPVSLTGPLAGEAVAPDPSPVLRMSLQDGLLHVTPLIRPHPDFPPQPWGAGPDRLFTEAREVRRFVERDRPGETALVSDLLSALDLEVLDQGPGEAPIQLNLMEGLDLLDALAHRPEVECEWLTARPLTATATPGDLKIQVKARGDWFTVEGGLEIEGLAMPVGALLEAVRRGERWVPVEGRGFVRVGDALRDALGVMSRVSFNRGKGPLRISPLASGSLEALATAGSEVEATADWLRALSAFRDAQGADVPLPEGLQATLRPYQVEGIRWLHRMALWSPGACLADDMGLGKTLQALALILSRSAQGPAVVVAPTSVGFNWLREAATFTPGLRAHLYRGPERRSLLEDVGPGDVLVTSYGLLVRDQALLAGLNISTLVFDEAQALKNPNTQRARSARGLDADFTLALTGTPVENRVGEVWSLFALIAPGLLGSQEAFRDRFIRPIEVLNRDDVRADLARTISPFLLRRRKGEVARELPDRLEEIVEISLSPAEAKLYNQLRIEALGALRGEDTDRFSVLAALTRLRQLACHPRLVLPDYAGVSSKERRLMEIAEELLAGGHRALVFSQFTGHLKIASDALRSLGAKVLYLDGATPAGKRESLVDRFQEGEADFFCISLKAGGTGLNLTQATWVIHLDPWWNPAVEDQATDRAHRIGQTEPVTVIRLVTRDTIEGEILKLHQEKRDLADALLAGSGQEKALSTEALVALLADHGGLDLEDSEGEEGDGD